MTDSSLIRLKALVPTVQEYAETVERIAVLRLLAKNNRFPTAADVAREVCTLNSESATSKNADLPGLAMDSKTAVALLKSLGLKVPFIPTVQG